MLFENTQTKMMSGLSANELWNSLDKLNQSLAQSFLKLSAMHWQNSEKYAGAVLTASSLHFTEVLYALNFL